MADEMADENAITEGVPPDDSAPNEPAEAILRRDIADELTDHLELSARAKQLGGADPQDAQQDALDALGNPNALARRLYFDAMKGKTMRQNIHTAALLFLTTSVIVLGVMAWWSMRASQGKLADAIIMNNNALMTSLRAVANEEQLNPTQWASLTVELVDAEGNPIDAEGYTVCLHGKLLVANDEVHLDQTVPSRRAMRAEDQAVEYERTLVAGNRITFGPVRIGKHNLTIIHPGGYSATGQDVTLWPGVGDHTIRITCPTPQAFCEPPKVAIDWPEDLLQEDIALGLTFRSNQAFITADQRWEAYEFDYICRPGKPARIYEFTSNADDRPMVPTLTDDGFRMQSPRAESFNYRDKPALLLTSGYELGDEQAYYGISDGLYQELHHQGRLYFDAEYDAATDTFRLQGSQSAWQVIRNQIKPMQRFRSLPADERETLLKPYGKYGVITEP